MTTTRTVERRGAQAGRPPLEIVRSRRRRRTATAYARDGVVVVQLPAGLGADREAQLITDLVDRVTRVDRVQAAGGDAELARRAHRLADRWLDGIRPAAVRWSTRMHRRHASCTPSRGTIRISAEAAAYPDYVLDALLIHELAHLRAPGHGADFRALVERFPDTPRAEAFLEGLALGKARAGLDADGGAPAD